MRTLIFHQMIVHKGTMYSRGPYILVECSCANKKKKSIKTLIFGRMLVHKRKKEINEDLIFGRMIVHKERVYER